MNIEEARKVFWLKGNNHRPLGELLEDRSLDQSDLEWAAEKAYDPKLKQAAKVILESLKHSPASAKVEEIPKIHNDTAKNTGIEVGISLDQARATLWPFSSHKDQSMGHLVDTNQLQLKDLGFAIENAWDPKVRQAAIALTLVKLNQIVKEPIPSAGFVHVVSGGRSYSERKMSWLTLLQGIVLGWTIILLLVMVKWLIIDIRTSHPNARSITEFLSSPIELASIGVAFVLLLIGGWLLASIPEWITKTLDKQIEQYRRGQEGEEKVVQSIIQALDGNWHVFQNINLPGRNRGDLDLVLVGPPGMWVLEVKNLVGNYRNIGENWQYQRGNYWRNTAKSPSRQVNNNAVRLANFLKADRLNVFVNSVVVWANPESPLFLENPATAVWRYDRLPDELGNIWQGEKLATSERNKIVEKLMKLCVQQRSMSSRL